MKRLTQNLSIAVITFFIGAAVPSIWLTFTPTFQACGFTVNGGGFGATRYKSSDGYELVAASGGHDSTELAQKALQEHLSKTTSVIERQPKIDQHGRQVGERFVALFTADNTNGIVILWTDEHMFYYVTGTSMRHVLALEKKVIADR